LYYIELSYLLTHKLFLSKNINLDNRGKELVLQIPNEWTTKSVPDSVRHSQIGLWLYEYFKKVTDFTQFQILWTRGHEEDMIKQDGNGQNIQLSIYHSWSKRIASKVKKGWMVKTNKRQKRATFTLNRKEAWNISHAFGVLFMFKESHPLFHQMVSTLLPITIRSICPTSSEISTSHLFSCMWSRFYQIIQP
jgi:hypothetical protein